MPIRILHKIYTTNFLIYLEIMGILQMLAVVQPTFSALVALTSVERMGPLSGH
jgi:hypothetical protein